MDALVKVTVLLSTTLQLVFDEVLHDVLFQLPDSFVLLFEQFISLVALLFNLILKLRLLLEKILNPCGNSLIVSL